MDAALAGDFRFWKKIFDRTDGKVKNNPLHDGKFELVIQYVDESHEPSDD